MTTADANILIVDDSAIIRKYIRLAASRVGLTDEHVHEAENGQVALDYVSSHPIDIVFLDLNMPVMDGEAFLRCIRAKEELAELPVVLVSTECNEKRLQGFKGLGVIGYLHKPFQPEQLRELIDRIMRGLK